MTSPTRINASPIDQNWRSDAVWAARLAGDRARAAHNQTAAQRFVTATVLERALSQGRKPSPSPARPLETAGRR